MTEYIFNLNNLNLTDIIIISVLIISTLIGLYRGFFKETITLTTWSIAAYSAIVYGSWLGGIIIFFLIIIIGGMINYLVSKILTILTITGITYLDKTIGGIFGIVRAIVIILLSITLLSKTDLINTNWWSKSILIPKISEQWIEVTQVFLNKITIMPINTINTNANIPME